MANTSQSKKRARQSEVRNLRNSAQRSRLRTAIKRVRQAITSKDKAAAGKALVGSQKVIDSMVNKHLIHKNKAARHKSRLNAAIKSLSAGA